jgi:hypothetical protein
MIPGLHPFRSKTPPFHTHALLAVCHLDLQRAFVGYLARHVKQVEWLRGTWVYVRGSSDLYCCYPRPQACSYSYEGGEAPPSQQQGTHIVVLK